MKAWIVVFDEPAPRIHLPKGALLVPVVVDDDREMHPEVLEMRLMAAARCAVTEWQRRPPPDNDGIVRPRPK